MCFSPLFPAGLLFHGCLFVYELAFRMQAAVPDLTDLSQEPDTVLEQYRPESRQPGTYAADCILARRLTERAVRLLGIDHTRLTYRHQGRDYRLTDVHGDVVQSALD